MPQLDFYTFTSQIFWLIISFSILYAFSKIVIIPGFELVKQNRQNLLSNNLLEVEKITQEVDLIKTELAAKFSKTKQDMHRIIQNKAIELQNNALDKIALLEKDLMKKENKFFIEIKNYKKNTDHMIADIAYKITEEICRKIFKLEIENEVIKTEIVSIRRES